jgi:hypothetical protein
LLKLVLTKTQFSSLARITYITYITGSHHIYNKETISSNKDKCKIVDFK